MRTVNDVFAIYLLIVLVLSVLWSYITVVHPLSKELFCVADMTFPSCFFPFSVFEASKAPCGVRAKVRGTQDLAGSQRD
jgi:hypothetical protein